MSVLLQLINLSFARQHKVLCREIHLSIHDGDRMALVGHNGSGKTSLLHIMAGRERPDAGEIRTVQHLRSALVEQFVPAAINTLSLRDAVLIHMTEEQRWSEGYAADALLQQLGFTAEQFSLPVSGLSGGQQNLLLIARAMVQKPQLLLLDEPGNHLDIQAMSQMQQFLAQTPIAWLLVSHDRALLNAVCTRTLFLRDERLYAFDLPYDQATLQLQQQDEAAAHTRFQEQREIDRLKVSAQRLATWGKVYDNEDLARKAKTMEKRIDRLEANRTFVSRGSGLRLSLASNALAANQVLYVRHLTVCAVPEHPLYTIDELILRPGDRVALLGVNGIGKSTTFNLLRSHYEQGQPAPHQVRFNPNVILGFYDQQLADVHGPVRRLEWLRQHTHSPEDALKQVLIRSGVRFSDFQQPVDQLSGGEKARMMFMQFRLTQPNFLILDEPTNHLDLEGKEQLEAELLSGAATLFMTSHDRAFIDRLATRWLWIHQGRLRELTSPVPFYESLLRPQGGVQPKAKPAVVVSAPAASLADPDAILARLDELEGLLNADLARKAKFQKPAMQQQWRAEIAQLWRQLEDEESSPPEKRR
jgi:ATPase subunit of ABC transporter with duplicated ATPase domains